MNRRRRRFGGMTAGPGGGRAGGPLSLATRLRPGWAASARDAAAAGAGR